MLRDKNLIPLSHQHQHALALCVRIDRAAPIAESDLAAWQEEIAQIFQGEIAIHFAAEEQVLFPAARQFEELVPLVEDLLADHRDLRQRFAGAGSSISPAELKTLAEHLSTHIRKEERRLFERLQELMTVEDLAQVGDRLRAALKDASQVCVMPNDATKLRSAR